MIKESFANYRFTDITKKNKINDRVPGNIKLNSFNVALMIMTPYLNVLIPTFLPISSPGNMFGVVITLLYIISMFKSRKMEINSNILIIIFYLMMFFIVSLFFQNFNNITIGIFINFAYYGVLSMLIVSQELSTKYVLKYIILLSLLSLINLNEFITNSRLSDTSNVVIMGYSYSFLPSVVASAIFSIYYRKGRDYLTLFGVCFNVYLLWMLFTGGTRGAVLALIFGTLLLLSSQFREGTHKTYNWILWIAVICGMLTLNFFNEIIEALYSLTSNVGLSINLINKTFIKSQASDVLNGRDMLYPLAIQGFQESPIWGQGIGNFNILYGGYPHNFILQLLFEGGLLLASPIVFVITIGFLWFLRRKSNNLDISMLIILFSTVAIPRLFVSANLWNTQSFWLLYGIVAAKLLTYRTGKKVGYAKTGTAKAFSHFNPNG